MSDSGVLVAQLLQAGVLEANGEVDIEFFAMRLNASPADVRSAVDHLVSAGFVRREERWQCRECNRDNALGNPECGDCGRLRDGSDQLETIYLRPQRKKRRDPAAVFVIHGMNSLGAWQEAFSWKFQLLYGYAVPVFVFKYGVDQFSPLTRRAQQRRCRELVAAVREAQAELARSGRTTRCDMIAHSFGTLLVSTLLEDANYADLHFGRVILTGAIVRESFEWSPYVESGRIEAVLNHRAGRDRWVRRAPWMFPHCGSSGRDGFLSTASISECLSQDFDHSDYFTQQNFETSIRARWAEFLEGVTLQYPAPRTNSSRGDGPWARYRFWVGRAVIASILVAYAALLVQLTALGA
jgi:hypothetical protein